MNQTAVATNNACTRPMKPPLSTSEKTIPAPMHTRPILMKYSVLPAAFIIAGTLKILLIINPNMRAKMTYSKPHLLINACLEIIMDTIDRIKMARKPGM